MFSAKRDADSGLEYCLCHLTEEEEKQTKRRTGEEQEKIGQEKGFVDIHYNTTSIMSTLFWLYEQQQQQQQC